MTLPALTIRPLLPSDAGAWHGLWQDYLAYYETVLPADVYDTTFGRLLATGDRMQGWLALLDGAPVGLVHAIRHRSCWSVADTCYLQDLFTTPAARGQGVARALIETVYRAADAGSMAAVYWFTQEFNYPGRMLYDQVATRTPFIRYNRRADAAPSAAGVTLRGLTAQDHAQWQALWTAYLTFYETTLPEDVHAATFARLLSGAPGEYRCIVAEADGELLGLAHHLAHPTCWKREPVTYLQDLFTLPAARGRGVARALIGAVGAAAEAAGAPAVYWLTQEFNYKGRMLYDKVAVKTPFIAYERPV